MRGPGRRPPGLLGQVPGDSWASEASVTVVASVSVHGGGGERLRPRSAALQRGDADDEVVPQQDFFVPGGQMVKIMKYMLNSYTAT